MKKFSEYINEPVTEGTLFDILMDTAKSAAKNKSDFREIDSLVSDPKTVDKMAADLAKTLGGKVNGKPQEKKVVLSVGSNTSISIQEPNGYDLYIDAKLFIKKADKRDLDRLLRTLRKLDLY